MAKRTIFITGAGGLLGGILMDKYKDMDVDVIALDYQGQLKGRGVPANVYTCDGDITKPDLGHSSPKSSTTYVVVRTS